MMLCAGSYPKSYDVAMEEEIREGSPDGLCHAVHPLLFAFDENGKHIEGLNLNPIDMTDGK